MGDRALVYGLGIAGGAVARALVRRGVEVVLADDRATEAANALGADLGVDVTVNPEASWIDGALRSCTMVCPAPGVPETHRVVGAALAAGVPLCTEIDLAYQWEQERPGGPRPMLGITGTDGKTTTTMMVAAMLNAGGVRAAAVGNTEVPLIAALGDDVDAFAVECSSFRLAWVHHFRSEASAWLNLAPDHQNWHVSLAAYEAAKARMWAHMRSTDVAIGYAEDPVVMANLASAAGRRRTFGSTTADYRREGQQLVGPSGPIADTAVMPRALPHDVRNALAAAAIVLEAGLVTPAHVQAALTTFQHPPHRIEPVGTYAGAEWYNDSKATTPHAALTAIRGFRNVVLLAGGRNKGLDLAALATEHDRIVGVVGLGEAAAEVTAAFKEHCLVRVAASMAEAVALAAEMARVGDTVLLSPACASFDWYPDGGYPARGDDFKRLVQEHFTAKGGR